MDYKNKNSSVMEKHTSQKQDAADKIDESNYSNILQNSFYEFLEKNNLSHDNYLNSISTAIAITATDGTVMFINNAFTQLFGLTQHDVYGKTIDTVLSSRKANLKPESILRLASDYPNEKIYAVNKGLAENKIYVSYAKHGIYSDDNLSGYTVVFHDISGQVKKSDFLETLFNISTLTLNQHDVRETYNIIVKELGKIWDTRNFFIALYHKEEQKVTFPFFADEKDRFEEAPVEKTATGYVIRKNKPLLLKESDLLELEKAGEIEFIGTLCKVWMGAPMRVKDEIIGVIVLQDYKNPDKFSTDDLNILTFTANFLAFIIQRKLLVSERKKAEKTAQKKNIFLSTMSHEIRTPLHEIISMINLLMQKQPRDDQMDYIRALKFSGDHLLMLVNDVLDLNKIESDKIILEQITFNIANSLDDIIKIYTLRSKDKNLTFEFIKDPKLPAEVIGDPMRLNQILSNILSNALKFTNEGGIKVTVNVIPETNKQIKLEFMISDTGIGIPKERHAKIFESYVQASSDTTRQFGGSGLGLAICKKLVNLQGGTLSLISEPGIGSTFTFSLPYGVSVKLPEPNKTEPADNPTSLHGKKILVAEDNKINFFVVNKFLTGWGIKVTHAENGQIALDKLKEEEFDLILMDLQMPVMDGIEASRIIRNSDDKHLGTIPIIALTAALLSENQEKFTDLMINDYILKPFKPNDLFERIARHIR